MQLQTSMRRSMTPLPSPPSMTVISGLGFTISSFLVLLLQALRGHSLTQYSVTLGARVNPEGTQDIKKDDGCTSGASSDTKPQACATGGISALTSSPTENYSYYAKTVLNTEGT